MGYFSNGTEGLDYQNEYCEKCVHYEDCAVMDAHFLYNYEECNKEESILHILIPRDAEGFNMKCKLFYGKTDNKTYEIL